MIRAKQFAENMLPYKRRKKSVSLDQDSSRHQQQSERPSDKSQRLPKQRDFVPEDSHQDSEDDNSEDEERNISTGVNKGLGER